MAAPIIMVPGAFCGGWAFDKFREPFEAAGHRCTAVDLPGHKDRGDRVAVTGVSMSRYAAEVAQVAARSDQAPILIGHSMGGLIAAQLALMWPRRVTSLALLCTFPDGKTGSHLTRDTFFTGLRTRIGTRAMRRKAFLSLVLSKAGMDDAARPALEAMMTDLFARDLADQPPIIMRQLKAMARYDAMWRLRCLGSIRTLVMSGGQDRIAKPEYGRALAAAIPGAAYVEVAHAAHAVPIETPWIVNRLLAEHLRDATRRVAS